MVKHDVPKATIIEATIKTGGVIFVSIDDKEQANLKTLMDEVFGEDNFVACFKWNKTSKAPALSHEIRNKYEYILCYSKTKILKKLKGKESYNTEAPLFNSGNPISTRELPTGSLLCNFEDGVYKAGIYKKGDKEVTLINDLQVFQGKNNKPISIKGQFKWSQDTINNYVTNGGLFLFKKPTFLTLYYQLNVGSTEQAYISPSDILNKEECGVLRNDEANTELTELLNKNNVFNYSKPVSLIHYLTYITDNPNALILDCFAGSGTTGHAVMKLNADDGGNRKFILVQLPEKLDPANKNQQAGHAFCTSLNKPTTIAEITKERLRCAGKKVRDDHKTVTVDTGFRVFKLQPSTLAKKSTPLSTRHDVEKLVHKSLIPLVVSPEDAFALAWEVALKKGYELTETLTEVKLGAITGYAIYPKGQQGYPRFLACVDGTLQRPQDCDSFVDALQDYLPTENMVIHEGLFLGNDAYKHTVMDCITNFNAMLTDKKGNPTHDAFKIRIEVIR